MPKLLIITVSTRENRKGPVVADWFTGQARRHGKFEVEPVDLRAVGLPLFDEPRHPRLQQYEHEHTKAWGRTVGSADAFVFVSPEYNHGTPPSLVNALDFVSREWAYKPAGFVSYGGVSGGSRGAMMTHHILVPLKVVAIPEAVTIPFFSKHIDETTGAFDPGEVQEKAAVTMLDELLRWAGALAPLRVRA